MKPQLRSEEDPSIALTVTRIAADLRHMLSQQLELLEKRLVEKVAETQKSMAYFFFGFVLAVIGLLAAAVAMESAMEQMGLSPVLSYALVAILYFGTGLGFIWYSPNSEKGNGVQNG
jgi:flagellar motor component MotA